MTEVLRPLTLAELLDRTFSLYRRHILVFVGLIALPNLLVVAARILNTVFILGRNPDDLGRVSLSLLTTFVLAMISMLTLSMSQAATVVAVSRLHLNQRVSIGQAFAGLQGRLFRLCFIGIALIFQIMFCFLLLIVPGIYVLLRWSLAIPVAVIEDTGLGEAMSRSATLVEGQYGRVFMIYVLYFLVTWSIQAAMLAPVMIFVFMRDGLASALPVWIQIALEVGQFATQCVVAPLVTIAIALAYYDSRVRKEAFDLQHMLAQLEPASPEAATTA